MSTPLSKLLYAWRLRDERYALRKARGIPQPLSDREVASIRAYRRSEALALPAVSQEAALAMLARWTPPRMAGI
jgi:hypothetical protein